MKTRCVSVNENTVGPKIIDMNIYTLTIDIYVDQ